MEVWREMIWFEKDKYFVDQSFEILVGNQKLQNFKKVLICVAKHGNHWQEPFEMHLLGLCAAVGTPMKIVWKEKKFIFTFLELVKNNGVL